MVVGSDLEVARSGTGSGCIRQQPEQDPDRHLHHGRVGLCQLSGSGVVAEQSNPSTDGPKDLRGNWLPAERKVRPGLGPTLAGRAVFAPREAGFVFVHFYGIGTDF